MKSNGHKPREQPPPGPAVDERIPAMIAPALRKYLDRVNRDLPGLMEAFYLIGSAAMGGFDPLHSDVDFVAVLRRPATLEEAAELEQIHHAVEERYPRWPWDGMCFQSTDLGRGDGEVQPFLAYHEGKVRRQERLGFSAITWWMLKQHSIAIIGPEADKLPFSVDLDALLAQMRVNLNTYWAGWTRQPRRILALYTDYGIQWAVLGVLRQYYTFREGQITTKTKAGEYALTCLPERWWPIIQEALALRGTSHPSYYHSRIKRMASAIRFIRYIIQVCN